MAARIAFAGAAQIVSVQHEDIVRDDALSHCHTTLSSSVVGVEPCARVPRFRNGIMEKKTQYVFTFTVPGYPTKLNNQVQDSHLSQSARDTAKATIKGG